MRHGLHRWVVGIVGLAVHFGVYANADPLPEEVPFVLHRDHLIVVEGSIGGLNDLKFVIDTGATWTLVSPDVARKLKLKGQTAEVSLRGGKTRVRETVLPELRIGSAQLESVPAWISSLSFIHGIKIDALIGLNVLRRTNLIIDLEAQTLTFGCAEPLQESMRFYSKLPFIQIRMEVLGQPLTLMLDSGAGNDLILFKRRVKDRLEYRRTGEIKKIRRFGGNADLTKVYLSEVRMGGTEWDQLAAFLMDEPTQGFGTLDGILGTGALDLKRFQLDFGGGLVSWDR